MIKDLFDIVISYIPWIDDEEMIQYCLDNKIINDNILLWCLMNKKTNLLNDNTSVSESLVFDRSIFRNTPFKKRWFYQKWKYKKYHNLKFVEIAILNNIVFNSKIKNVVPLMKYKMNKSLANVIEKNCDGVINPIIWNKIMDRGNINENLYNKFIIQNGNYPDVHHGMTHDLLYNIHFEHYYNTLGPDHLTCMACYSKRRDLLDFVIEKENGFDALHASHRGVSARHYFHMGDVNNDHRASLFLFRCFVYDLDMAEQMIAQNITFPILSS